MITSHETESDYTSFFSSLKEISKLENLELKPKWIAIDACNASANEIKIFFPDCQIVMCYFHLKYNTRKRKSLLGHRYIQVIRHITSLHNTKSKLEFQQKYKLISQKWKKCKFDKGPKQFFLDLKPVFFWLLSK